jgi:shikimate dehydrogenase
MKTDWDKLAFPRLCGLLGVNPSRLSQAMHNAGFKSLGLDFSYHAFNTLETAQCLQAVREMGFRGLSLTIPHKEIAFSLVDELSEDSKKIGAINTLINTGTELVGYNSDWCGIQSALDEVQFSSKNCSAVVLGAGGAAKAGVYALKDLGVSTIYIANRTEKRASAIADEFGIELLAIDGVEKKLESEVQLIVNATPLGLKGEGIEDYPFSKDVLSADHTVFDMVTKETALVKAANAKGASVVLGIRMLLHQAVKQFELFTEQKAPLEDLEAALLAEYSK